MDAGMNTAIFFWDPQLRKEAQQSTNTTKMNIITKMRNIKEEQNGSTGSIPKKKKIQQASLI